MLTSSTSINGVFDQVGHYYCPENATWVADTERKKFAAAGVTSYDVYHEMNITLRHEMLNVPRNDRYPGTLRAKADKGSSIQPLNT